MSVCVVENLSRVFLSEWPLLHLWVMRVYIVWVKGKEFIHKNPPGRKRLPGTTLQLPVMCSSHALSRFSFSWNPLILHLSLSLYQLNTKSNTIKSHKIQGTKLEQLQHFLSWNKANIKYSCKSQLYIGNPSNTR